MISRAEIGIQAITNEIFNEAYKFGVSPYRVMDEVRTAVGNKMKCVRAANPENVEEVLALIGQQIVPVEHVNYKCSCPAVWGGSITPNKIIYSGNRTIVFWSDGTKTIVKLGENQEFDEYTGFIAAYAKKMFGSTSKLKKLINTISFHNEDKVDKKKS